MNKPNRIILLIIYSVVLILSFSLLPFFISNASSGITAYLYSDSALGNSVYIKEYDLLFTGLDRKGCTYFFLPSFIKVTQINQELSKNKLLTTDGSLLTIPPDYEQDILVDTGEDVPVPWKIAFLKSENLSSVFIKSDFTDISTLNKESYAPVTVSVYSVNGSSETIGCDSLIKTRGNATAEGNKKPYELKFNENIAICGMNPSNKYALLANSFEDTKLYNKMAFDTSAKIGMEYSIESDWVDLYANGVYLGNYLLCKEPDIGKNDLDIGNLEAVNAMYQERSQRFESDSLKGYIYDEPDPPIDGGYLFQKLNIKYYRKKDCGFKIDDYCFCVKSPDNASKGQLEYISSFVKQVDNVIQNGTGDKEQLSLIDAYSFSRRFLIEEFFFNRDAFINSYFFYKKPGINTIYAGPVWDYDTSIGQAGDSYLDYNNSLFNQKVINESFRHPLKWDYCLYDNKTYRTYLINTFAENIPVFQNLIDKDIDQYYKKIEASRQMDAIVWGRDWYSSPYRDNANNIRYTKFFLTKRMDYLCERWGLENDYHYDYSNGSIHTVTFLYPDDNISNISVADGDQLPPDILPDFDESIYRGWCYDGAPNKPFSCYIPVFEDMTLALCPIQN